MALTRNQIKKEKRRKSGLYKFFKTISLLIITLLVIGGAAFGYLVIKAADVTSSAQQDLERGDRSEKRDMAVNPSRDSISVLFLGVDDRTESLRGRTDAMILATFNKDDHTIKMVSIPRDSRVEIAGRNKMDKINHAHAFGGVDTAISTVESLFDIPVDYFVKLNFDAFMEIINELGGVELDVKFSFTEMDSNDKKGAIKINKGLQTLNGEEALAYVRMRKADPRGDLGRGERQQEVIKAIIEKTASMSSITKYDNLLDSIEKHLAMNFTFQNIVSLHKYGRSINNIETMQLDGENSTISGVYYYKLKEESIKEISTTLKNHLGIN
ncbi:LCP family protein [Anaerobacillus isosaccharinicus]|uniref:LCP family protein n=1 Tax=Anaerobacillus isosaccharinicus TaxID=1532552 RepID=A0A1S2LVH6_9BACI|nr:LCP family protein [Anaerobacillus isosaccharinicus]MBA5584523.1 LCP family protein [Anaerobacillus isosaccharinicus]QOY37093.1 LCP family protein [Anaerobacillus isosaccharinicus]